MITSQSIERFKFQRGKKKRENLSENEGKINVGRLDYAAPHAANHHILNLSPPPAYLRIYLTISTHLHSYRIGRYVINSMSSWSEWVS